MIDIVDFHRDIVSCSESSEEYLGLAGVESQTGELSGIVEEVAGQAFKYKSGDILYGRLRPYLNKVLLAESSGICSTEFHVMRIKEGVNVLPEYLSAILRSDLILSQTKHMMTGNTHPRISNDDVKNLYIPIPELSIQRQIVEELSRRRAEARKLKQQAEADWADAKAQFEKELLGEK
jgi:restriction endonuclease S subunit